ncbi:hypothetical protein [Bacillus sp. NEB1478]|uniref:hypothetical protein n=1 Tax=Bacillus sp. NEB1478 TaxID=3073816 RepID=UPI0028734AA0|nr:hypothetical protein [Bacillus sp. NEB1478]WNB91185.1 hypothetical protein RGB74_14910 [Bacillus sp. NEB1478]
MQSNKNFTAVFCLLFGISPLLGMTLKNATSYSAKIGWGFAVAFLLCAAISNNKRT